MSSYGSANYTGNDWLYGQGYEWTLTPYSTNASNTIFAYDLGHASSFGVESGCAVRPVVYLDPSLYVVSGDGTILNPYKIAWPSGS